MADMCGAGAVYCAAGLCNALGFGRRTPAKSVVSAVIPSPEAVKPRYGVRGEGKGQALLVSGADPLVD